MPAAAHFASNSTFHDRARWNSGDHGDAARRLVAFFMHLAGGRPIYRIVFVIAMAFLVLLVLGILADVGTRSIASSYVDDLGRP
jgi:hypothetical protein